MTEREFKERLSRRAKRAKLLVPDDLQRQLYVYLELLARWNTKINLTALPLNPAADESVDRLLIEPLAAARFMGEHVRNWVDLGSGGGSPAIPLKIACPAARLTMVESKARKAAFLREAIRTIPLDGASVENIRFEELSSRPQHRAAFDLITVRAVKLDVALKDTARALLNATGRLWLFTTEGSGQPIRGFERPEVVRVGPELPAYLAIYGRIVPRGT